MVGAPAGLDAPVDLEASAAVVENDTGARCHDARPEGAEETLDERDRHPVAVDGAQVDRPTGQLGRRRRRLGAPPSEVLPVEQVADLGAVANVGEGVLERESDAGDSSREVGLEALEESERLKCGNTLSGRRQLDDLATTIREAQGSTQRGRKDARSSSSSQLDETMARPMRPP